MNSVSLKSVMSGLIGGKHRFMKKTYFNPSRDIDKLVAALLLEYVGKMGVFGQQETSGDSVYVNQK